MENIDDYSVEELLDIFELKDIKPLRRMDIHDTMSREKQSEENKNNSQMLRFIEEATQKLLDSIGSNTRQPAQNYVIDDHHIMDKSPKSAGSYTYQLDSVPDTLNPIYQSTIPRILNLDSKFRKNSYPAIDSVTGHDETYDLASILNVNGLSTNRSSTEYVAYLSNPLTSILSFKLYNIAIPYVWYNIDPDYGNSHFQYVEEYEAEPFNYSTITDKINPKNITIAPGQYDLEPGSETNIYAAINNAIRTAGMKLQFEYDPVMKGTKIHYFTKDFSGNYRRHRLVFKPFTILWYNGLKPFDTISKADHNLGWKLGFRREISYIVNDQDVEGVESYYIDLSAAHSPLGRDVFCHVSDSSGSDIFYNTEKTISYDRGSKMIYYNHDMVYDYQSDHNNMVGTAGDHLSPFGRQHYLDVSGTVTSYWKYSTVSDAPADLTLTKYLLLSIDDYNNNQLNSGLISIQNAEEIVQQSTGESSKKRELKISQCPDGKDKNYYQYSIGLSGEVSGITKAQVASINAVAKHRAIPNNKTNSPTELVFAIIQVPANIRYGDIITNRLSLVDMERKYFGPITLSQLKIKLLTEDGAILNLNKCDWAVSLICNQSYQ